MMTLSLGMALVGCNGSDGDEDSDGGMQLVDPPTPEPDVTGETLLDQPLFTAVSGTDRVGYLCEVNQGLGGVSWRVEGTSSLCSGSLIAYLAYDEGSELGTVTGWAGSFVLSGSDVGMFSTALPEGVVQEIPAGTEATIDATPEGTVFATRLKVTFQTDVTVDIEVVVDP